MNREPERNPRKALGKGLSALLPSRSAISPEPEQVASTPSAPPPENFQQFQSIPLDQIQPGEQQPRENFDDQGLQELSQSIRVNGLIQPITVYKTGPEQYRIIAGERRWRAAKLADIGEIPAFVRSVEQQQLLEMALVENLQRQDLNPIEIAAAFQRLANEHGLSHEQIAERPGKDRSTVTNLLRLLKLSPFVRQQLIDGQLTTGHARALLNIPSEAEQLRVCRDIVDRGLSVRETEKVVKVFTKRPKDKAASDKPPKEEAAVDPNVRAAIEEMTLALGTRVRLVPKSESAGRLEIEYYSQDDLDRIYSLIVRQ
jgi:ParB family chromosome partitioning protein